jgi:SAM-dependent methyltransferase
VATYTSNFFQTIAPTAVDSARVIVPRLLELVRPRSVVDVGCGTASWLRVFKEHGVDDVLGIDGDYVPASARELPPHQFQAHDLAKPLRLDRRFDLVLSLEVGEHLPPESADVFVDSLVSLGPVVAFSAAVPQQGGTHHVNEQWPEYWVAQFARRGYSVIDCLRGAIWQNPRVAWFYAQNLLLFATDAAIAKSEPLSGERARNGNARALPLIHPAAYLKRDTDLRSLLTAAEGLGRLVKTGEPFILADQEELRSLIAVGSRAIPFMERDGQYWGAPPDAPSAIAEVERLREAGVGLLVIAWPAFWLLENFPEFDRHLRQSFACITRDQRFIAFHLTKPPVAEGRPGTIA